MECKHVRNKLVGFIDNEISDEAKKSIQAHLDNCINCSRELESLRNAVKLWQCWKDIEPTADWEKELKGKLTRTQRQPETELEILRSAIIGLSQRIQKLEETQGNLPPTLESEIMTVNELARYLRISARQIYEIIEQIPKFQIGYEYRFVRESIDRWIRSMEQHEYPQSYPWRDWFAKEDNA